MDLVPKDTFCFSCLCKSGEVPLQSYDFKNSFLYVIFQVDQIRLCCLCMRIAHHADVFIKNVQSNQISLGSYHVITDATLEAIKVSIKPSINLSKIKHESIHLDGNDSNEDRLVVYNSEDNDEGEVKEEYEPESDNDNEILNDNVEDDNDCGEISENDIKAESNDLENSISDEENELPLKLLKQKLELEGTVIKCLCESTKNYKLKKNEIHQTKEDNETDDVKTLDQDNDKEDVNQLDEDIDTDDIIKLDQDYDKDDVNKLDQDYDKDDVNTLDQDNDKDDVNKLDEDIDTDDVNKLDQGNYKDDVNKLDEDIDTDDVNKLDPDNEKDDVKKLDTNSDTDDVKKLDQQTETNDLNKLEQTPPVEYYNSKYKCDKCLIGFRYKRNYDRHVKKHSKVEIERDDNEIKEVDPTAPFIESYKSYKFKCHNCVKGFRTKKTYEDHMKKHSKSNGDFECDICKQRMSTASKLNRHRENHKKLKKELTVKPQKKKFECKLCNERFAFKEYLKCHQRRKHPKERKTRKRRFLTHVCEECGETFDLVSRLNAHADKHLHPQGRYCVECDKRFTTYQSLQLHLKTVKFHTTQEDFRFTCSDCDKRFTTKGHLERHISFIHSKTTLFCDKCDQKFKCKYKLKYHMRKHDGPGLERKFICKICSKGFHQGRTLDEHLRTHTGAKPYHCTECPAEFAQYGSLYNHRKWVHKSLCKPKEENKDKQETKIEKKLKKKEVNKETLP